MRSPIYHLGKLKAKVFLIHGEDDKRTPIDQYEELADKLEGMNYPFGSLIKDNEKHGFYSVKNNIEL